MPQPDQAKTMAHEDTAASRTPKYTTAGNATALCIAVLLAAVCAWMFFAAADDLFFGVPRTVTGDPAEVRFAGFLIAARLFFLIVLGIQFFRIPQLDEPWQFLSRAMLVIFDLTAVAVVIVAYAQIYRDYGLIDTDSNNPDHNPATALYFSMVTWTTVGYGDFKPVPAIRLIAASEGFVGYVGMAIFIVAFWRVFNWRAEHKPRIPRWLVERTRKHRLTQIGATEPEPEHKTKNR
jgi:Ion channel